MGGDYDKPGGRRGWISGICVRAARTALALAAVLGSSLVAIPSAQAQTFTVLYNFTGSSDGAYPYASLVRDAAGNLYGTTYYGGSSSYGVVFKVDTSGTESVLYTFTGGADGGYPFAGLVRDKAGNLYGTTVDGGTYFWGTVFKLSKTGKETVLYSFTGGAEGEEPLGRVTLDPAGHVYGATEYGGGGQCQNGDGYGCGTVWKLTP